MKLFINNKRIKLLERTRSIKNEDYDGLINAIEHVDINKLKGKILVTNASNVEIITFLKILELKKLEKVKSLSFLVDNVKATEKSIKKQFKIIKAAGGVVVKNDTILLIHRLGIWDFPKGKLESGETSSKSALREVEEECNVKVELLEKICSTWHSYTDKDKKVLKKTTWYRMQCIDDKAMKPQIEEQIDKISWMTLDEAKESLKGSYASINYVMKKFKSLFKV